MPQNLYLKAVSLHREGRISQAEPLYLQVISLQPKHADAHHMLGVIYYQTNRPIEAAHQIEQALVIQPRNLDYLNNYGLALRASGQLDAAVKSFQQAVLLQPKDLDVQINLGNTLLSLNRLEEAAGYYRRVLRVLPKNEDIRAALTHCLSFLGNQAHAIGNYVKAETYFQEACKLNPHDAAFFYNLGNAQRELAKSAEAVKSYQKSIQLDPNDADVYNNLGNVHRELGFLDLAISNYTKALEINPNLYHAKVHLVHQKQHICDWHNLYKDVAEIRHWVNTIPEAQISPFAFLAMPSTTSEEQKKCADHWVKNRYATLIADAKQLNFKATNDDNHRKIKIGYLSADFRLHPLAFLITELIELHDRSQFEIIGFSYGINDKTSARERLVNAFDAFHDIRNLSEIDAAKKVHACSIDILVDLTGYTQTSRSGIAALRPAPINVNWLGFPGTMGEINETRLFDYLLTDHFITPPESTKYFAEKLAILPHSYQPNDSKRPIGKTPTRQACGLPENKFVFCCFNQSFKITPEIFSVWMRLLKSKTDSVLWLLECNQWAKQNLIREALAQGISEDRLIFAPRVAIADHLARHLYADLFLDTQPYNAHTTCSDALWMGLPVLTCVGDTFPARVAGSLLQASNLNELITYNLQDYENKALYISENPKYLTELKQKTLASKTESTLFNTAIFAKSLEEIYRTIYAKI